MNSRKVTRRFPRGEKVESESRFGGWFSAAAIVTLLATVCLIPWIHGGNIPLARLVLQTGSAGAALLSLVAGVLRKDGTGVPGIILPLGVLAAVGFLQLTPVHTPTVSRMNHAVLAELRNDCIDFTQGEMTVRTPSPGDTRLMLAQLVALMLLAITAFDRIRTRQAVVASLAVFSANAAILSLLAIVQLFRPELFLIHEDWWTGRGAPFGTFVNPNNAAGWLTLGLASAIGLLVLHIETSSVDDDHSPGKHRLAILVSGVGRYAASLTSSKVLVWFAVAVIACGIAATNSRGGMIAAVVALVVMTLVRLQLHRFAGIAAVVLCGGILVSSLMVFLNLHQDALLELQTLRDPSGELAGRVRHWCDSLRAVLDFPVFGAGLGAYRYITRPYQTRDTGLWFQNADNHFVEVLVEAGIVGCVAFVMLGLPALIHAVHTIRQSIVGTAGRSALAAALTVVFAVAAQAVSALVDFGVGMPAASSLFVVLVSILTALQASARLEGHWQASQIRSRCIRLVLIAAGVLFAGDLLSAHECYSAVIAGRKLRQQPMSWEAIRQRELLLDRTMTALKARSDDARAHELLSWLRGDIARSRFLKGLPGLETEERFQNAWSHTACLSIARRIESVGDSSTGQKQLKTIFLAHFSNSGITEHANQVVGRIPLSAPVVRRAARWVASAAAGGQSQELQSLARFIEPSNGQLGLDLGEMALLNGRLPRAVATWKQVLKVDESLRYRILGIYSATGRLDLGLKDFGPETYAEAVGALMQSQRQELTVLLRRYAASLWTEPESRPSTEYLRLRDDHLRHLGDSSARIAWLERCVIWQPDNLRFHQELAKLYAREKRWGDSEDEWYEVLRLDAENRTARRGIAAIRRQRESRTD